MAKFRRKPLGVLDRIYGFVSGQTQTGAMTLESPITTVHDVSREAELGTGVGQFGGYFFGGVVQSIAGAATADSSEDPYAAIIDPEFSLDNPQDYDVWLIDLIAETASGGSANLTSIIAVLSLPTDAAAFLGTAHDMGWPLHQWLNGGASITFRNIADTTTYQVLLNGLGSEARGRLPMLIPRAARLRFRIVSTAAIGGIGVAYTTLYWAGKRGVTPPGFR